MSCPFLAIIFSNREPHLHFRLTFDITDEDFCLQTLYIRVLSEKLEGESWFYCMIKDIDGKTFITKVIIMTFVFYRFRCLAFSFRKGSSSNIT